MVDTVLFSALLLLTVLPLLAVRTRLWIVIPLYLATFCAVLVIRMHHAAAEEKDQSAKAAEQKRMDQLLLLNDDALSERFGKKNFILIRKEHPDRFDVMDAIRKQPDAIGLFSAGEKLKDLIKLYSPDTEIYGTEDLLGHLDQNGKAEGRLSNVKIPFIYNINKYLLLGLLLFAASFFIRMKIYFRVIASACLIIAFFTGVFGYMKRQKNFLIFLDKWGD